MSAHQQWPRPCKFDASCGEFGGPRDLSVHYRSAHTQEAPREDREVVCFVCRLELKRGGLLRHVRLTHPTRLEEYAQRVADGDRFTPRVLKTAKSVEALPVKSAPPLNGHKPLPPLGPDDVDGIVLGVVEQLAEPHGVVPISRLPAIFRYRDATTEFLRDVTK